MSHADNKSETENAAAGVTRSTPRYGEALLNGRKRFALTVDDICRELNITPEMVARIESSAVDDLPPVTFMQGYIRAYAKLVEIPVDPVLQDFARAMPQQHTELRARSTLPREADRHSPVIKGTTIIMLVCGVVALIYGTYSYYSKKVETFEEQTLADSADSSGDDDSLALPAPIEITQSARITEDDQLLLLAPEPAAVTGLVASEELPQAAEPEAAAEPEPEPVVEVAAVAAESPAIAEPVAGQPDRIVLYADEDSWIEVTDAEGSRLFYNLLKQGGEVNLSGVAPFSMFLGNAPDVTMRLNNVDIKVTNFTRANRTAKFRVSTRDGAAVFHRR